MTQSWALVGVAGLLLMVAPGCSRGGPGGGSGDGSAKPASAESKGGSPPGAKGQAPNTVTLTAEQQQTAGIRVEAVELRTVPRALTVPGQVALDEQRTAHVAPYSDGRVVEVLQNAGALVTRGTVLASMHSHSVHETAGALAQDFSNVARQQAAVSYAQQKRDRYAHLYSIQAASLEQQQGSEQELLQAKTELANAEAAVTMEREHLGDLLALRPESINAGNLYEHELVPIRAPIAGTIITRSVTPGMVLEPGNEAFTISDLSEVWAVASVHEADLAHLHAGEHVVVHSDAWPGQSFAGIVTLIGSSLDPATRTVQLRATLPNRRGQLKPMMFVTATIEEHETRQAIFVGEDALQEVNGVQVVFVTVDGTHFSPRALKTMPPVQGTVEVTSGLRPGEHIVAAGAFLLKSELLKSTLGEE